MCSKYAWLEHFGHSLFCIIFVTSMISTSRTVWSLALWCIDRKESPTAATKIKRGVLNITNACLWIVKVNSVQYSGLFADLFHILYANSVPCYQYISTMLSFQYRLGIISSAPILLYQNSRISYSRQNWGSRLQTWDSSINRTRLYSCYVQTELSNRTK